MYSLGFESRCLIELGSAEAVPQLALRVELGGGGFTGRVWKKSLVCSGTMAPGNVMGVFIPLGCTVPPDFFGATTGRGGVLLAACWTTGVLSTLSSPESSSGLIQIRPLSVSSIMPIFFSTVSSNLLVAPSLESRWNSLSRIFSSRSRLASEVRKHVFGNTAA